MSVHIRIQKRKQKIWAAPPKLHRYRRILPKADIARESQVEKEGTQLFTFDILQMMAIVFLFGNWTLSLTNRLGISRLLSITWLFLFHYENNVISSRNVIIRLSQKEKQKCYRKAPNVAQVPKKVGKQTHKPYIEKSNKQYIARMIQALPPVNAC